MKMQNSPVVILTIPGRPRVLKNGKRIFRARGRGKRAHVLPSEQYSMWEHAAMIAIRQQQIKLTVALVDWPCEIHYRFYLVNRSGEPDVSNLCEGPGDVLQKVGVLANDKLIMRVCAEKFFGADIPRTEIQIFKYATKEQINE